MVIFHSYVTVYQRVHVLVPNHSTSPGESQGQAKPGNFALKNAFGAQQLQHIYHYLSPGDRVV